MSQLLKLIAVKDIFYTLTLLNGYNGVGLVCVMQKRILVFLSES